MSSDLHNYGIIGFTSDNVGIDRRIYTGLTSTDPVLNVSYNGGRVDVYLNGIKLVGDHSEMPSGTRDYTFTQTGSGSSIQLRTGVALVSADVVECIGHVGLGSNTITTYNYTATSNQTAFTANNVSSDLVNVFLNGVLLDSSDYNLNTSNTVTLASGATASDIVHIQVIGALDNSNFVPAGGGTFSGNVAVTGNLTVDTDTLKVDSSNNRVGIKQTGPASLLTVGSVADNNSANTPLGKVGQDPAVLINNSSHVNSESQLLFGYNSGSETYAPVAISYKNTSASSKGKGDLLFATRDATTDSAPTERMRIASSGNVGINENPNRHSFQSGSRVLTIKGDGTDDFGVLELLSPDTTSSNRLGEVRFGNMDGHATAVIATAGIRATRDGADDATALSMWAGGSGGMSQRLGIDSGGDVTVNTGNLVIGTAGKGIDFSNASGSASGSSSALLDDYEEGTWTPVMTSGTGNTISFNAISATYTKIGRIVHINMSAHNVTSSGTTGSGAVQIAGIPFAAQSGRRECGTVLHGWGIKFSKVPNATIIPDGLSYVYCAHQGNNSNYENVYCSAVGSGSYFGFSMTYRVA